MINIHLYPAPIINESRILREAGSLARLNLFERIDLVGAGRAGLPAQEKAQEKVRIVRIGERDGSRSVARKIVDTAAWSQQIYRRYRNAPLACINCHSVATLPLGVLLKRATGARLVYDAHELETEANGLGGVRKYLTKQVERRLIRHADHCIFVGRAIEDWYIREYGLRNTTVLYNCPPWQHVEHTDYFRAVFPIPMNIPIFLYQGLISEGRGMHILVETFSELEDEAALVIMGYGPLTEWVCNQAACHQNIYYHPAVPPARLLAHTGAADYGLSVIEATSVSYEYCMPNKLFEYVMAKKPVLVSPTWEQMNFVEQYRIGEVAENISPTAVRKAARRLMARSPKNFDAALNRAREEYCWERQEEKLEAAYLDALGFRPLSDSAAMASGAMK